MTVIFYKSVPVTEAPGHVDSQQLTVICHATFKSVKTVFIIWILWKNVQDLKAETVSYQK